jgi:glycosyltransferase involved in cell wall biosynthesis
VALAPSLWPEPFSRSVIEPLACGVPVIGSRVGGNPEILTGWLDDYLVPPGDVDALADCVRSLVGWRQTRPELAERLRSSVVERLSLDREVDTVEACLASVARRRDLTAITPG